MKTRIAISVFLLASALFAALWYYYCAPHDQDAKPKWGDYISPEKIGSERDIEGAWALGPSWKGYMGIALQLDEGRYRYWFYSDVKTNDQITYPIEGNYKIKNGKLILENAEKAYDQIWIAGRYKSRFGLWPSSAIEQLGWGEAPDTRMLRRVERSSEPIYNSENEPNK